MCSPSPPPAPDFAAAAKAQGEANLSSGQQTALLNNPNIVTPFGTQTYTQAPDIFDQAGYDAATAKYEADSAQGNANALTWDPEAGEYRISGGGRAPLAAPNRADFTKPDLRGTLTQAFSPEQQALYNQSVKSKGLLADLGIQGAEALQGVVGRAFDLSNASARPEAFTPGGAPPSAEDTRSQVIAAMMGRANIDIGQQADQANSDLIARGLRPGTEAYSREMDQINRRRTDALQQAQIAGGNAAAQQVGQNISLSNLGAQQQAQRFGQMDINRRQQIAEMLTQRQTPLNEISALASGSQVSNPFAGNLGYQGGASVSAAPVMSGVQQQGAWDQNVYAQEVGANNALMSGLFGLGAAGLRGGR